jgi:hypothetical protein
MKCTHKDAIIGAQYLATTRDASLLISVREQCSLFSNVRVFELNFQCEFYR